MTAFHTWSYRPTTTFHGEVHDLFLRSFTQARLAKIYEGLCSPSVRPTLRVNTLIEKEKVIVSRVQELLKDRVTAPPFLHPEVSNLLVLPGAGPLLVDYKASEGREVVVNRFTGEAVLKGADVYAPGLLACSSGVKEGDLVGVSVARELPGKRWTGFNRGHILGRGDAGVPDRSNIFVGVGRTLGSRKDIFKRSHGLVVAMTRRVFDLPPCNGLLPGQVMLQSLPCVLAVQVMGLEPGMKVLDMCAAPGGKTTTIAQAMEDRGTVVALDRTQAKVDEVMRLVTDMKLKSVRAYKMDATTLCQYAGNVGGTSEVPLDVLTPESYDAVLLDPPCSALGLRPRLAHDWTPHQLERIAAYQRALLHSAVHMLRPGGVLMYCTCTFNPGENEANVRFLLDRWPELKLTSQKTHLGDVGLTHRDGHGLPYDTLTPAEAEMVQRFDPGGKEDTIGFFMARFYKTKSTQ